MAIIVLPITPKMAAPNTATIFPPPRWLPPTWLIYSNPKMAAIFQPPTPKMATPIMAAIFPPPRWLPSFRLQQVCPQDVSHLLTSKVATLNMAAISSTPTPKMAAPNMLPYSLLPPPTWLPSFLLQDDRPQQGHRLSPPFSSAKRPPPNMAAIVPRPRWLPYFSLPSTSWPLPTWPP